MTHIPDATEATLDRATSDQIRRANAAVEANLVDGVPRWDSAQGYACALTAIIEADKTADSLRAEIREFRDAQGIEAATADETATEIGGSVHESPVAEGDAPNPTP